MEDNNSILSVLIMAWENMTWIEIWAVITGLIYVILAVSENIWCWFFGIISSLLSIYLFYTGKLYAESVLYFYYVIAGIYGWYAWVNRKEEEAKILDHSNEGSKLKIHTWDLKAHGITIVFGMFAAYVLAYVLENYTDAKIPRLDAFTTVFSFIATYMVTRKVLENWIYWIIIDVVTTGMYFQRAYYLYALLMIVYTVIAILGYIKWRKTYSLEKKLV